MSIRIVPFVCAGKCFLAIGLITMFLADMAVAQQQPNIVFMLSDDQNWNGLSVPMHPMLAAARGTHFNTPSLEKLAAQGMRFSAAYAPAPVCSPTRISLQTGKSPAQMHWTKAAPTMNAAAGYKLIPPRLKKSLASEETTIAELLQSAGYATAHYGKWHLDGGGPGKHGYDAHDGNIGNEYAGRFGDPNPVDIFGMVRRANAFMEKSKRAGKPFFIQLSWHALHSPQNALKSTLRKYDHLVQGNNYRRADVAAITENLDTGVGRIMSAIERLGLADNTYVIYMSDNGGGNRRGPLNGGKGSVWEGGVRVPLIIRGPGIAANSWCHTRVVGFDFFPTFCQWAGLGKSQLPAGIEGGSIATLVSDPTQGQVDRPREELVFHFPHYQTSDGPHSAIILGDLKLLKFYEGNRLALFDLSKDIGEQNDLSRRMPQQTAQLHQRLNRYLAEVGAQLPVVNPGYDPSRPPALPQKGKGRGQGNRSGRPRR